MRQAERWWVVTTRPSVVFRVFGQMTLLVWLALSFGPSASAQATCTWGVNGPGAWGVPANWVNCGTGNGTPAGTPGPADTAIIALSTPQADVSLDPPNRTVDGLQLRAGRLSGTADLTVTGQFIWSGGELSAAALSGAALVINAGAIGAINGGAHYLSERVLRNLGTLTWSGGDISLVSNGTIDNRSVFNININGVPQRGSGSAFLNILGDFTGGQLINSALPGARIEKLGTGFAQIDAGLVFDNQGDVLVSDGRLQVVPPGPDAGTYQLAGATTLDFAPGTGDTRNLNGEPSVTGTGVLRKRGQGAVDISGTFSSFAGRTEVLDGLLTFNTASPTVGFGQLRVDAPAILDGDVDFLVTGTLQWNGGQISGTGGSLTLLGASMTTVTLNDSHPTVNLVARDLINQGTVLVSASGGLVTEFSLEASNIDNQGSFELRNAGNQILQLNCVSQSCGSFENRASGTLTLNDIGGIVSIQSNLSALNNAGLVDLINGCAAIDPPGVDTGTYRYTGSCTLAFFTRIGSDRVFESTVVLSPQGATALQLEGRLRINGASRNFQNLLINPGATLFGPADITLDGNTLWRGVIEGVSTTETVTIGSLATVQTGSEPGDTATLRSRTLINNGALLVQASELLLDADPQIVNNSTLSLVASAQISAGIGCSAPPVCGALINVGTLDSFAPQLGLGPIAFLAPDLGLIQQGQIEASSGVLLLDANYTATAGSTLRVLAAAVIDRSSGPLVLAAGTLTGDGIVRADVQVDSVDIAPGVGPGGLSINGSFSATTNTTYSMEIGGVVPPARQLSGHEKLPAAQYDRLTISGPAMLSGNVNIIDIGYVPSPGDTFILLSYASFSGGLALGSNPHTAFLLDIGATRTRFTQNLYSVCQWNPGGGGPDDWTNTAKWINCAGGLGPGPGPVGTPGAPDRALIAAGNVNLDVPVVVDALEMTGGVLTGSNDLLVNGEFIWTGGAVTGPGGSELQLGSAASGLLSGGQKTLDGRTLRIGGASTWTTGLIELANAAALVIDASGGLTARPSAAPEQIYGSGAGTAQVINDGTIVKEGFHTAGIASTVEYLGIGAVVANLGEFYVAAPSPSPFDGSFVSNGGGNLRFTGASRSFGTGATFTGNGLFTFGDAGPSPSINQIDSCMASPIDVRVENAEVAFNCGSQTDFNDLNLAHPGAVVEGSSLLSIVGQLEWNHGTIRGSSPGQIMEITSSGLGALSSLVDPMQGRFLNNRQFINHGQLSWLSKNPLTLEAGAELRNEADGMLRITLPPGLGASLLWDSSAGARLLNLGIINVDAVNLFTIDAPFDQSGTVNLNNGATQIQRGGIDSGDYVIAAGARLGFRGASAVRTLGSGSSLTGAGILAVIDSAAVTIDNVLFAPDTIDLRNLGTLQIDAPGLVTINNWFLDGGILTGSADLAASDDITWVAGRMVGTLPGLGVYTVLPGASLHMAGTPFIPRPEGIAVPQGTQLNHVLENRELRIQGAAEWRNGNILIPSNSSGRLLVDSGGVFNVSSIDTPQFGCVSAPCVAEIDVAGSLQMNGNTANLQLTSPMTLSGNLFVNAGAVVLPDLVQSAGVIRVAAGASLDTTTLTMNGGSLQGSGIVSGNLSNLGGNIDPGLSPGNLSIIGNYVQGSAGTLNIQIGGLAQGIDADYLFVSGTATLDGTVVIADAGYTPTPPESYAFLNSDSAISGTFSTTNVAYPGYEVSYSANDAILSPLAVSLVVNSILDPGTGTCDIAECTLREAINFANTNPGPDIIQFAIPGGSCVGAGGACVILPGTPLPPITESLLIDGYSQPGASPNTHLPSAGAGSNAVIRVEIDGSGGTPSNGLTINAPSSLVTIAGLAIHSFLSNVVTQGPDDLSYSIVGNFIGLRADGSAPGLVAGVGISIMGGSTAVGDSSAAGMNVISGNQNQGIAINTVPMLGSAVIRGNLIGTDPSGLVLRPNGLQGIIATTNGRIPGIVIGGNLPDDRNVISGNLQDGIRFDCFATSDLCFDGARVTGNFIGPAADASPMGNIGHGVNLAAMSDGRVYIGGTAPGDGNLIAFNGGNGISATFGGTGRGTFQRNQIFGNTGLAIDLGADGRTPNDANDPDFGPNGFLNFPYFTGYVLAGSGDSANVDLMLDTPDVSGNYPADVDLYLAIEDEPGVYLGSMTCPVPNSTCSASVSFPAGVVLLPGDVVLGIVVDGFGKSSEASFYATTTTILGSNPDPSNIGTPYDVDVEVASIDPFAPVGDVDIDDGTGNSCVASLSESGPGLASGTCQLATTGPSGTLTLSANYLAAPTAFTDSSDTSSHMVNALPSPPVITLISPAFGPAIGGDLVTITGSNFVIGGTSFDFGVNAGLGVNCTSTTRCTVSAPVGTGDVNIRATTMNGSSVNTRADDYSYRAGAPLLCTNFVSVGSFPAGSNPYAMAAGDFNGDGQRDVAVVNNDSVGSVSVLLGTGAGAFAPASNFAVGPFPRSVAIGDFNSDGFDDLAVANYGATTISILLGTGTGSFGAASSVSAGSGPHAVAVGDFNGDGRADLAVALLDASSLAILLGDGTGSFGPPTAVPGLRSVSLGITDFNQDGVSDIAVGNQLSNAASVVLGTGAGSFGAATDFPVGTNPTSLAVGDFDGNGYSDLAVANRSSNSVSVLIAGSMGILTPAINYPVGTQPVSIDLGDFDGDGLEDLVVANSGSNDFSVLPGIGSGSFGPAITVPAGPFPSSVLVGDFDGSGNSDLLVAVNSSTVVSLRNAGCPPAISSLNPAFGSESGGTSVSILGTDFVVGATSFAFGPNPATSVNCLNSTTCLVTSPAGTGVVDVIASTLAGPSSNTLADDFTYNAVTLTSIAGIAPEPSAVGEPYTVTVSVSQAGTPVAAGLVEVRQLSDGASCTFDLATAGSCPLVANSALNTAVRAYYLGTPGLAPSVSSSAAHLVIRASTTTLIASDSPDPSAVGQEITVEVQVSVLAPGAGVPTGQILVTDGSASCGMTLPTQTCTLVPKVLGVATLEARYLGDANFASSIDTEEHTITVAGADLSIILRNGLRVLPAGQPSTYVLLVSNAGPQDVVGARVTDLLPPQLSNASWTCAGIDGGVCPASGVGTVDALVNLPAGASVTFLLTVTAQANPEQIVTNRATVSPPISAPDPILSNNESIDVDPIGTFGDGFEDENE